jgi:hypothetical protein
MEQTNYHLVMINSSDDDDDDEDDEKDDSHKSNGEKFTSISNSDRNKSSKKKQNQDIELAVVLSQPIQATDGSPKSKKKLEKRKEVKKNEFEDLSLISMSASKQARRVRWFSTGLTLNLLYFIGIFFTLFISDTPYDRWGPHDQLIVGWVRVNTWTIYLCLLIIIVINNVTRVWRGEVVYPWLVTNLYNHQQSIIYGMSKWETAMVTFEYDANELIYEGFSVIIMVSQVDLLVITIIVSAIAHSIAIRSYVNEKMGFVFDKKWDVLSDQ